VIDGSKRVLIVGAGVGGLATALRLRRHGFQVTVVEKQSRPGGRSNVLHVAGFRVDTGPTILVMKDAFQELYRSLGLRLEDRLRLVQMEPNYRIHYHDGTSLDLSGNMARLADEVERIAPGSATRLFHFLGDSARKYELAIPFVDQNYDHITDLVNPVAAVRLLRTSAQRNLYRQVAGYFGGDDRLAKAFSFHSMFLGLSPLDALAMYSLITYADLARGVWYPMGGVYSIVEDLVALADQAGVTLRTSSPVAEIRVEGKRATGVALESGEFLPADVVISNADLPYTYRKLIAREHRPDYTDARLDRMQYACSGYVLYLGLDTVYSHLSHQGLFFAQDYRANLDAIFRHKTLPADPSFHICVPTVTDPSLAPAGHSLIYLLAPMPNLSGSVDWEKAAPVVRRQLLSRLEQIVHPDIARHIVWERHYLPTDWQRDVNAPLGTAFGSLAQGFFQSAYFRPHNRSSHVRGLYFVGQGTYPGIGMPMVVISSRLVTERVVADYA
jgi:phytoene desaturase